MKWALVNNESIIENIVMYDGKSSYDAPFELTLKEVNDWLDIGDPITKEKPAIEVVTLEQKKESVAAAVYQKRDEAIASGVTVNGNRFYTDASSLSTMMEAIMLETTGIKEVFPRLWILMSGEAITVTLDEIKTVASAIADKKDFAYANYITLLMQIQAAEDDTALEAIDINQGWPE